MIIHKNLMTITNNNTMRSAQKTANSNQEANGKTHVQFDH